MEQERDIVYIKREGGGEKIRSLIKKIILLVGICDAFLCVLRKNVSVYKEWRKEFNIIMTETSFENNKGNKDTNE